MTTTTTYLDGAPTAKNGSQANANNSSAWSEIRLFLELAIPTALVNFGFIMSPLLTASYVGRKFGVAHLSGFTLANLTGNLFTFSAIAGLFSASDTLGPQAFGLGDYREVGLIAVRGFVVNIVLVMPMNLIVTCYLRQLLVATGQDPEAAQHASDWYRIFVCSLPFWILYNSIWKFLSAQHIMRPLIYVSLISCCIILPLGLQLLTNAYGFLGSAYAYVNFQAFQALMLLGYVSWFHPHVRGTWPSGFATPEFWKEGVLHKGAVCEFLHLGMGGAFAQCEWFFWEALGLIIGLLGVVPLSVHTIPNQVTMALCLAPFSAATALTIRIGYTLPNSVERAQSIAMWACIGVTLFFGVVDLFVFFNPEPIIGFFSTDPDVMVLAKEIWWKVCTFNFQIALFALLTGVATGLGKQWTLGYVNFFFLFILGLPICYYLAVIREGGLGMAWTWINFPYLFMNSVLVVIFASTDWHEVQQKIKDKEIDADEPASATSGDPESAVGERQGLLDQGSDAVSNGYGAK